jgi:hypothetical protein
MSRRKSRPNLRVSRIAARLRAEARLPEGWQHVNDARHHVCQATSGWLFPALLRSLEAFDIPPSTGNIQLWRAAGTLLVVNL